MGRTQLPITPQFDKELQGFANFRRALRRSDQIVFDDLFVSARQHLAAAAYATHALPFETFLLSMLIEQHKHIRRAHPPRRLRRRRACRSGRRWGRASAT